MSTSTHQHSDRITITGIEVFAYHGVHQFERDYGQKFVVDLSIGATLQTAGESDALEHTIDYGQMARLVVSIVKTEPVNLLETLAERICAAVLAHPLADSVEVTVHKPEAPLDLPFTDVSVTLVRHNR